MDALLQEKNTYVVQAQIENLRSESAYIRRKAARFLGYQKAYAAIPTLRECLEGETDGKAIRWFSFALALLKCDVASNQDSAARIERKQKMIDQQDVREWTQLSVSMLRGPNQKRVQLALDNSYSEIRKSGIIESWMIQEKESALLRQVQRSLEDENADIRKWAVLSLGNSRRLASVDALADKLTDPDYLVREWAEWALYTQKDVSQLDPLQLRLISDPHPRVREWAAKSLAIYPWEQTLDCLIQAFLTEEDLLCREGIISSLGGRSPDVAELLFWVLGDKPDELLELACLEKLGDLNLLLEQDYLDRFQPLRKELNHPKARREANLLLLKLYFDNPTGVLRSILTKASARELFEELSADTEAAVPESLRSRFQDLLEQKYTQVSPDREYQLKFHSLSEQVHLEAIKVACCQVFQMSIYEREKLAGGMCVIRSELRESIKEEIAKKIANAAAAGCRVILFPELTIPLDMTDELAELSRKHSIYLFGGLEHEQKPEERGSAYNRGIVVTPEGTVLHNLKNTPVRTAKGVEAIDTQRKRTIHVYSMPFGIAAHIICRDWLEGALQLAEMLRAVEVDMIFVSALSPTVDDFIYTGKCAVRNCGCAFFVANLDQQKEGYGGSFYIDPNHFRGAGQPFSSGLNVVEVDLARFADMRSAQRSASKRMEGRSEKWMTIF
ncbi:MAG: hypothetical protein HFF84_09180 [Oscillibacter sp.]|nr:hypothetical protein [Oscillibacter sp.]